MNDEIIRKPSPEEEELEIKKAILSKLADQIAVLQLEISTVNSGIESFRGIYLNRLGKKFLYLDELLAKIAQVDFENTPNDESSAKKAEEANERMKATAEEVGAYTKESYEAKSFEPDKELKILFRKVTKLIHPDLAKDDEDRVRRNRLMQQAIEAYRNYDKTRLQEILDNEKLSDDKDYSNIAEKLVVTIKLIASAKIQIDKMNSILEQLKLSDEWTLKTKYETNIEDGTDIFDQMEKEIDEQISNLENALSNSK